MKCINKSTHIKLESVWWWWWWCVMTNFNKKEQNKKIPKFDFFFFHPTPVVSHCVIVRHTVTILIFSPHGRRLSPLFYFCSLSRGCERPWGGGVSRTHTLLHVWQAVLWPMIQLYFWPWVSPEPGIRQLDMHKCVRVLMCSNEVASREQMQEMGL